MATFSLFMDHRENFTKLWLPFFIPYLQYPQIDDILEYILSPDTVTCFAMHTLRQLLNIIEMPGLLPQHLVLIHHELFLQILVFILQLFIQITIELKNM